MRKNKEKPSQHPIDDPSSIGNVLMRLGRLTREQLHKALGQQSHFNEALLGSILRHLDYVSDKDLLLAMKIQGEMRCGREIHAELDVLQEKIDQVEAGSQELKDAISAVKARRRERGENSKILFFPTAAALAAGRW